MSWVCDEHPECADGSDESSDLCMTSGKCGGRSTALDGLLSSPSYPKRYSSSDCTYTIEQPTGTFINISILMFDLNFDDTRKDYLEIRDGNSELSSLIGRFYGQKIPEIISSTQNNLWIRWGNKEQ